MDLYARVLSMIEGRRISQDMGYLVGTVVQDMFFVMMFRCTHIVFAHGTQCTLLLDQWDGITVAHTVFAHGIHLHYCSAVFPGYCHIFAVVYRRILFIRFCCIAFQSRMKV
eukprot:857981_1